MRELPDGWARVPLGDLVKTIRPRVSPHEADSLPFVGMDHVEPHTMRLLGTVPATSMKSAAVRFEPGDVLYGRLRPYLNKVYSPDFHGLASAEFIPMTPSERLDADYLRYVLNSADFVKFASGLNTGDRPRVDFKQLASFPVLLPPLSEQARVTLFVHNQLTRLHVASDYLRSARQRIVRYRDAVLTAESLGRSPGIADRQPSQAGADGLPELPAAWRWATIDRVAKRVTVGHVGPMKTEYVDEGVPFLRSQNVRANRFEASGLKYISRTFHRSLAKSTLLPGDVVVVRSGDVGTACVIPEELSEANCADLVIIQRPTDVDPRFISYYLNSAARRLIAAGRVGVALTHFNTRSVAGLPIPVPPPEEQSAIIQRVEYQLSVLDQLSREIAGAERHARALRNSVLTAALRGEIRTAAR